MNAVDIDKRLLRHYASAQTPWGRWRLNLHFRFMRALWRGNIYRGQTVKRAFDITISLILLAMLSPLFLLIGLLVKLEDGGPILFAQTRAGQFGREFKMFKIRSMCLDAEEKLQELISQNHHPEGVTFKIKRDPRITKVGRWLRKYSLDELPQIYNVLIGDMSSAPYGISAEFRGVSGILCAGPV